MYFIFKGTRARTPMEEQAVNHDSESRLQHRQLETSLLPWHVHKIQACVIRCRAHMQVMGIMPAWEFESAFRQYPHSSMTTISIALLEICIYKSCVMTKIKIFI